MLTKETRNKKQEARVYGEIFFFFLFSFFFSLSATAQCAMCRAALESEGNKTKVEAVNDGIVFLMAVPYLIVAVIGFAIYRMYFKKSVSKEEKLPTKN
jgi:heme/copper-type cytochrome/quinol oxidase subunit 2